MTITATVDRWEPSPHVIAKAARIIKAGGLVAFPTETVYGLGADAFNVEAVRKIFAVKGRPENKALILHICKFDHAEYLVEMNEPARKLARRFWPGPLTLVLPAKDIIPEITRGGLSTAAVRMPDNVTARALIAASGTVIAAPSANPSGKPAPLDAESVLHDMAGKIDMIIDGGSVTVGVASTVLDMTDPEVPRIIRQGTISHEMIESVIGVKMSLHNHGHI